MSTAAPPQTQTPSTPQTPTTGYSFARPLGKCSACGRDIAPGEKFTAAVRETALGLERVDLSGECWTSFDRAAILAYWQTTMPTAAAVKPKIFVDDAVLCDLFERLGSAGDESSKLNFRFVLGLILMRKRLLIYEATRLSGEQESWTVRLKGREESIDLLNPRLNEDQIAEVTTQLGQILSGEGL